MLVVMLRLTMQQSSPTVTTLLVEGKLSGPSAIELLATSCKTLRAAGRAIMLDLQNVTFVDEGGTMLLQEVLNGQTRLAGCSEFVRAVLDNQSAHTLPPVAPLREAEDLVAQLRRGDDAAFARMVREFGGRMLATARRILSSEDDAHDALQDAFLCAFRSIANFKGDSSLATWLHRIVVNAALMQLRAKKRRPEEPMGDLLPSFDPVGNWLFGQAGALPPPAALESFEARTMVRRCIDELPPVHRTVLMLRDIEELDTDEVVAMLGLTANAVKVRLHRARQALRTLIARERGTAVADATNRSSTPTQAAS